jgi:hypothetical protein
MDRQDKQRRVAELAWYHTVDLGDGIVTPGQYDHRPILGHYGLPDDLTGKSALDIGPAHGFFSLARGSERGAGGRGRTPALERP